jgi:hypothetical protein
VDEEWGWVVEAWEGWALRVWVGLLHGQLGIDSLNLSLRNACVSPTSILASTLLASRVKVTRPRFERLNLNYDGLSLNCEVLMVSRLLKIIGGL